MTPSSKPASAMLLALLLLPGMAAAADSADAWLERMNHALHELNYEGRFVYLHGQTIEAMYLSHTVNNGEEREHLVSLTGLRREVIRDNDTVTCMTFFPEAPRIDRRPAGRRLSPVQPIRPHQLSRYYHFELGAIERIAGRQARVISIVPMDDLRYGYQLVLDREHALPLATATIGVNGQRLSQVLFTELRVGEEVDDPGPSLSAEESPDQNEKTLLSDKSAIQPQWRFQDLPDGFVQIRQRHRRMGEDGHQVEHYVFSDGLATVSVYLERDDQPADDKPQPSRSVSHIGAVTALTRMLSGYRATAVGEVPQHTLQRFLDGIRVEGDKP